MKTFTTAIYVFGLILFCAETVKAQTEESIFTNGQEVFLHRDQQAGMKSFLARNVDGHTYLAWVTENFNNDGSFVIYRSTDGENYEIIGVQQTTKMPRMSDLGYFFIDNAPGSTASVYYKVLYLGTDNSFFKSARVAVKLPAINFAGNNMGVE